MERLQAQHPEAVLEVWAFEEHRLGLLPLLRRVWAPRGQRPTVLVEPRFQWTYLYGFVHPQSGLTHFQMHPRMNTALLNQALQEFARAVGASPQRQIALVLDGAPSHRSRQLVVPAHVHLVFLPPYSPELQPAEHLWPLTNQTIANTHFATLEHLTLAQQRRCDAIARDPELTRDHTLFHWWPLTGK